MEYKGFYINLKSQKLRKEKLIKHLEEVELFHKYECFEALKYPDQESKLFGLKTKGEYGLWLSILKLLEKISRESYPNLIHIIEDDFRFNSSLIYEFKNIVVEQEDLFDDIIFLDYLIDIPLLNLITLISKQKKESSKLFKDIILHHIFILDVHLHFL